MTKRIAVAIAALLIMSAMAVAQQATSAQTSKDSAPTSLATSKKLVSLSGRVSDDGKTLVTAVDGVAWMVANPEELADNFGARVVVRGHVDAANHQIEVVSVRVDTVAGARLQDVAFRR